jgi:hypothetical protein
MTICYGSEHAGRIPRGSECNDEVSEQRLRARAASLLGHSGLAQASEIGGFKQVSIFGTTQYPWALI